MDYNAASLDVAAKKNAMFHTTAFSRAAAVKISTVSRVLSWALGTQDYCHQFSVWPNLNYWSQSRFLLLRCYSAE